MRKIFTILVFLTLISIDAKSAIKFGEGPSSAVLGGYVRSDMFFDTRNLYGARDNHLDFYPVEEKLVGNEDVNERFQTNMLSIQTRLNLKVTGPDVLGAKSFGFIEAEFFGTSDADMNGLRLRHAYIDLNWGTTSLRMGQTWHPLFDGEMFAGVVSFNTGIPFQPFARAPQIRFNQAFTDVSVFAAISTQRDFGTAGPVGVSNTYLKNSGVPDLSFGIKYKSDAFTMGINGEYKIILPRTTDSLKDINNIVKEYRSETTMGSFAANAYIKLKFDDLVIRGMGFYGQNTTDLMMFGGFAEKWDSLNGTQYKPINVMTVWGEVAYGKDIEIGIFAGYGKNLGVDDNAYNITWGRNAGNLESVMRISPRVIFTFGSFKFCAEIEYTTATYGQLLIDRTKFESTKSVSNVRGLLAFMYNI